MTAADEPVSCGSTRAEGSAMSDDATIATLGNALVRANGGRSAATERLTQLLTTVSRLRRELAGAEADLEAAIANEASWRDHVAQVFDHYRAVSVALPEEPA